MAGILRKVTNKPVPSARERAAYSFDWEHREMLPEHLRLNEGVA